MVHDCIGSYISRSNAGLQNWSTSNFESMFGPSLVLSPDSIRFDFTRTHTVGLPYFLHGTLTNAKLEAYEDRCLQELHVRCLAARISNAPLKVLLMELLLAGNGGMLSDGALTRIGILARHHNFCIILDEIMTGGRTGTMLLLSQKPLEFAIHPSFQK